VFYAYYYILLRNAATFSIYTDTQRWYNTWIRNKSVSAFRIQLSHFTFNFMGINWDFF